MGLFAKLFNLNIYLHWKAMQIYNKKLFKKSSCGFFFLQNEKRLTSGCWLVVSGCWLPGFFNWFDTEACNQKNDRKQNAAIASGRI